MQDDPEDSLLWARARAGHAESFGLIFERHADAVYGYCRVRSTALHGGDADAADLMSVVFLEAWRRRRGVEMHQESVLPWLLGIARLVVLRRGRSMRRHRAALDKLPRNGHDGAGGVDPSDEVTARLDSERRLRTVRDSFAGLSRRDQEVLVLCGWGGLDYAAAAVALGIPVGTVRSRLSRARARLVTLTDEAQLPPLDSSIPSGDVR